MHQQNYRQVEKNPTSIELFNRMWGISAKNCVRMSPTSDEKGAYIGDHHLSQNNINYGIQNYYFVLLRSAYQYNSLINVYKHIQTRMNYRYYSI